MKRIELLNSEGPYLKASHHDSFDIDEKRNVALEFHGGKLYILSLDELKDFLKGSIFLRDSRGKLVDYAEQPNDMKPSSELLDKFLNYNG